MQETAITDPDFVGAKLVLFLGQELAVILRDARPDIPWPGRLDLPGGGRDGSESLIQNYLSIIRALRDGV